MANAYTYNKSLSGGREPLRVLVPFSAGSSATVERGAILELASGNFIELDADQSMAGVIAVADEEIKATSLAGYYPVIVPRPGDVFDYDLSAAANPSRGDSLYWVSATTLTTSGSNILCKVFDHSGYPQQQGRADVGDVLDRGTTIRNTTRVSVMFLAAVSYYVALQA